MACTRESGTCEFCRSACSFKPGWFLPGEAERAAEFMGMTLPEFFRDYLAVDWWEATPDIFLLSPAIRGSEPGTEFPGDPCGECVFYKNDRCGIHPVKPHECRLRWCGGKNTEDAHEAVAMAWVPHQDQVRELLGREPETESFGLGKLLGLPGF